MRTPYAVLRAPTRGALATVVVAAAACVGMPTESDIGDIEVCPTPEDPSRISIRLANPILRVGLTAQVEATPVDAKGQWVFCAPAPLFETGDSTVATVSPTGIVTGVRTGNTYIRAKSGPVRDSVAITVVANTVASVAIKSAPPSLLLRQTVKLGVELHDSAGNVVTPISVIWRSEDTAVATITNTGMLVAVGEGVATVTLEAEGLSAVARIPVNDEVPTRRFRQIAGGFAHTCALVDGGGVPSGTAYCWGDGTIGQLGVGQTGYARVPLRVAGGQSFAFIAAGSNSSCGITTSGETYCWGANENGQLGDGTMTNRIVPVRVATTLAFRAVAIGSGMTCGLTADGSAYCWGRVVSSMALSPTVMPGGIQFVELTGGGGAVCGRVTSGRVYCWGLDWAGATPTAPRGGLLFSQVSAGAYHVCGIAVSDGLGYCWGRMSGNQLGRNVPDAVYDTPVAMPGGLRLTSVSASNGFTCAVAETGSFCLGNTGYGGTIADSPLAVPQEPRRRFATLAGGEFHACAIDTGGGGWCWGRNLEGQLGAAEANSYPIEAYQLLIR